MIYILMAFVFIMGLFSTIGLRRMWEFLLSLEKVRKKAEMPPNMYFTLMRILGILLMIIAFLVVVNHVESLRNDSWFLQ